MKTASGVRFDPVHIHLLPQTRWTCPHCGAAGWWVPATHIGKTPLCDHDRPDGNRCIPPTDADILAECAARG